MNAYARILTPVAILVAVATMALADKIEQTQDGIVLSATADTLVITDREGKNEQAHKIDEATAITIDGKPAKLPDLSKGDKVKVTVSQDGKVVRIMATRTKR